MQSLIGLLRSMRPKQWTKNIIIYAGIVFDGQLLVAESLLRVTVSFVLLCLISSSVYIINDLADIESDRQHPRKRHRAIASGQLPKPLAVGGAIALIMISIGGALLYSPAFALVLAVYLVLHLLYSVSLKHIVIIDVMVITAGFLLRVAAGVVVIHVARFSPLLYVCVALLAMFLAIGKRRQELLMLADKAGDVRVTLDHYNLPLLDDMLRIVLVGTLIAYLLYAIEEPSYLLQGTNLTLLTVPFVFYGVFRYLYLMHVRGEGSAPDEVLLKDRPLLFSILLWGLTFVAILYFPALI